MRDDGLGASQQGTEQQVVQARSICLRVTSNGGREIVEDIEAGETFRVGPQKAAPAALALLVPDFMIVERLVLDEERLFQGEHRVPFGRRSHNIRRRHQHERAFPRLQPVRWHRAVADALQPLAQLAPGTLNLNGDFAESRQWIGSNLVEEFDARVAPRDATSSQRRCPERSPTPRFVQTALSY